MKRSFSAIGKGASTPTTPAMQRAASQGSFPSSSGGTSGDSALFLVQHQNKELAFELKNKRRSIADLRGQLQHEKKQSAMAEELLSVLDRSYNQFNDDISRMISVLTSPNDDENDLTTSPEMKSKEWLSLLQTYLESGETYFNVAPVYDIGMMQEEGGDDEEEEEEDDKGGEKKTLQRRGEGTVDMLQLRPDDWASVTEIEELRREALGKLDSQSTSTATSTVTSTSPGVTVQGADVISSSVAKNLRDGADGDAAMNPDVDMDTSVPMDLEEDIITPTLKKTTPPDLDLEAGTDTNTNTNIDISILDTGSASSCHDRVRVINTELCRRTRSIKAKLHSLLKALQIKMTTSNSSPASPSCSSSSSSSSSSSPTSPMTQSMVQTRHLRAEKLLLSELLAKYRAEIVNLQAAVRVGERRLVLSERAKHFTPAGQNPSDSSGLIQGGGVKAEHGGGTAVGGSNGTVHTGISVSTGGGGGDSGSGSGTELLCESNDSCSDASGGEVSGAILRGDQELVDRLAVATARQVEVEAVVTVLQNQLTETDDRRSAAEQALAVYIYHTVVSSPPSTDNISSFSKEIPLKLSLTQKTEMTNRWSREALELERTRQQLHDLRLQSYKKMTDLEMEKNHLSRRASELELALSVLTQASDSRMAELTVQMSTEMTHIKREKEAALASLRLVQQELQLFDEVKSRLVEVEAVEASTRRQCEQLTQRIVVFSKTAATTDANLSQSRSREAELTSRLSEAVLAREQAVRELAYEVNLKEQQAEAEEGMITEGEVDLSRYQSVRQAQQECHSTLTALVATTQARVDEVTAELKGAKEGMNELILEIEGIANAEQKSREQNVRLVKLLADAQGGQKEVRMENLRQQQDMQLLREGSIEYKLEREQKNAFIKKQEEMIEMLKGTEQKLRAELHQLNVTLEVVNSSAGTRARNVEEAETKCSLAESISDECRRKMADLKSHCGELGKQHDAERKRRLSVERELAAAKATNKRLKEESKSSALGDSKMGAATSSDQEGNAGNGADDSERNQMLELTLNMLRCSVCHDRFKEVAITRCFHLFCKQCIDMNLSSRHRKCPACGEKFGQDDVKAVYFTH